MTVAVFASGQVDAPPDLPTSGLRHTFTSWEGVTWHLSQWQDTGVLLTDQGIRGLHLPAIDDFTDELAGVDGQHARGFRLPARSCFWPVLIWDLGQGQWAQRDAEFWRALRPGQVGTWTVSDDSGRARHLRVRVVSRGDEAFTIDPTVRGWHAYGINLVADDPWWHGDPVLVTGEDSSAADFIDSEGSPPFHISGGAALAGLTITNPGEAPAWPIWRAVGPHTDLVVGVGGHLVQCPDVASGELLEINTSPVRRTVLLDGVDVFGELGTRDFAPVPPGESVALHATSTGAGSVQCHLVPRYFRAW